MALLTTTAGTPAAFKRRIGTAPILQRHLYASRRGWVELIAAVVEPLMYLLTMGVGLGKLVGHAPGMEHVSYAAYVAPGLLAMAAMNASTSESIFGAFNRLKETRLYDVVLATPMSIFEIARSEFWWATARGMLAGLGFLGVMAAFGLVGSWSALLIVPTCALVSLAFATSGLIVATYVRDFTDFQYVQLVMLPMFLFATTFYPLSVYPSFVQAIVRLLPLYHSINVIRGPALGDVGSDFVIGVCYMLAMSALCGWFAVRRLRTVLIH